MSQAHLAYHDPDTTAEMASDASACRGETEMTHAATARDASRRPVRNAVPGPALQAPQLLGRTSLDVSESTARFAEYLFD